MLPYNGDAPADGVGGGAPPAALGGGQLPGGGGPPDLGQPVDGMGNLEGADEEGIDPNMPDLLEWNGENGGYGYPDSDDDEDNEEEEGGQGGEEPPVVRSNTRGNKGVPPIRYLDVF